FKAISDHADDLHKRIYNWLLKIPSVTLKEYKELEETKNNILVELESIKNERKALYSQISNMTTEFSNSQKIHNDELNNLKNEIKEIQPSLEYLLKGTWKSNFTIHNKNGVVENDDEVFILINGDEYHVKDKITGLFNLKFKIENYQFRRNDLDPTNPHKTITFNKMSIDENRKLFAKCSWVFTENGSIIGKELLYGSNERLVDIKATKIE
ncbi:MAG: hypothetical protein K2Q22_10460, partial [Cytophagales bacterium]|nr:hypothetical protein [Cytophagales bacterium]